MADLIGIAASAAGGGVFGVLGTALGRLAGYFERRQTISHEQHRWAHELQLLERQQVAAAAQTEAELQRAHAAGRWSGLQASLEAETAIRTSYKWVDAIRGLTRPALTVLLWLITVLIWCSADDQNRATIIETATFAATAATLWWFGDRGAMPKGGM
jgi:hypothetical protein